MPGWFLQSSDLHPRAESQCLKVPRRDTVFSYFLSVTQDSREAPLNTSSPDGTLHLAGKVCACNTAVRAQCARPGHSGWPLPGALGSATLGKWQLIGDLEKRRGFCVPQRCNCPGMLLLAAPTSRKSTMAEV